jgi:hypothetical protein
MPFLKFKKSLAFVRFSARIIIAKHSIERVNLVVKNLRIEGHGNAGNFTDAVCCFSNQQQKLL